MSEDIEEAVKVSPVDITPKRVSLSAVQLEAANIEEFRNAWTSQDNYIDVLETQFRNLEGSLERLKEGEERLKQQHVESQHRERVLVRRLAAKEQEIQDFVNQIAELKASQATLSNRPTLLDPAVNLLIVRLKQELGATRARLEETQNELSAWKFTPDSNTGKKLMAKCRLLHQENEDLGRMTSSGRIAKLEGDLALQKSFSEEVKKSQSELDEFLQELDEDVEGMQSTVLFLQQELRAAKEKPPPSPDAGGHVAPHVAPHRQLNGETHTRDGRLSELERTTPNEQKTTTADGGGGGRNGADATAAPAKRPSAGDESRRTYTSDSDSECSGAGAAPKKRRRASVLSLDYNEEDDPLTVTNGEQE